MYYYNVNHSDKELLMNSYAASTSGMEDKTDCQGYLLFLFRDPGQALLVVENIEGISIGGRDTL